MHYPKETPSCSTFRVIKINFRVSEILGFLRYAWFDGFSYHGSRETDFNAIMSIRVLSDRFWFIWTELSANYQMLFMFCFSNILLLFAMFQQLNLMDWTHITIQKWKLKEYPNRVIIGQIRHLSDKCSVLFWTLETRITLKDIKVSLLYLKRYTQDVKTDV